jgi:hypothetical protein
MEDEEEVRIFEREPTKEEFSVGMVKGHDNQGDYYSMIGVPQADRITHFYMVGASGMGKTKLLEHFISQDVRNEFGFGILDPHGDLVRHTMEFLTYMPWADELDERVILIDPTDKENTVSFNPLELTQGYNSARQAKQLTEVFHRIWGESWGDRMADILTNTLVVLIENNLTLNELLPCLTDATFRNKLVERTQNDVVRDYFKREYNELNPKTRSEWLTSTSNKVRTFLLDEDIKDIFLSTKSSFNFREIIDNRKILLVRIPKGLLGDENSNLLGSLILSHIQMAAFSRADITNDDDRVPFYLYIDEFQNFAAKNFAFIMDEARKYKLALTLAHQNLSQVPSDLKSSLLNCNLQAYFRVSRVDAEVLAKELFAGVFLNPQPWERYFQELQTLLPRTCYMKNRNGGGIALMITPNVFAPLEKVLKEMGGNAPKAITYWKDKEARIGQRYLRKRSDIRAEYAERRKTFDTNGEPEGFREKKRV